MKTDRLKRLLVLALMSDKDGERINALDAISRILAADKHDAHWLAEQLFKPPEMLSPREHYQQQARSRTMPEGMYDYWGDWLEYCSREPVLYRMKPREREFIESLQGQRMRRWSWSPSKAQANWLYSIHLRMSVTDR